jgi:hypothetical protein
MSGFIRCTCGEGEWQYQDALDGMISRCADAEAEVERLTELVDNWHASNHAERQARLSAEAEV